MFADILSTYPVGSPWNTYERQHEINRDYYIAIFISTWDTHISPRTKGPSADMGQGLILSMVWKLPYHNLFIIHFSFWQVYLFDIICSQRQDLRVLWMWWYGFLAQAKKPYHPCDLAIWVFCLCKNAVSPTWPIITPFALHKSDMCLKAMLVSHMQNEHIF